MSELLRHTEDGVLTLTLNRLDKKNALNAALYAALADALDEAAAAADTRVVLIQGHEQVFCAGNDLSDFLQSPEIGSDTPVLRFLHALATFPKPLIAAVAGPAVGVGTTMLLHCDLVYAGDNAVFSLPFVNLGLCPEAASSLLLPRLWGHPRAAEALLLAEPFGVEQAFERGLVNRIVPPNELNAFAAVMARKLAAKPLASLVETKRLLKAADAPAVQQRLAEEIAVFGRMLKEPAAKEAFTAFLEKRKPDFSRC